MPRLKRPEEEPALINQSAPEPLRPETASSFKCVKCQTLTPNEQAHQGFSGVQLIKPICPQCYKELNKSPLVFSNK